MGVFCCCCYCPGGTHIFDRTGMCRSNGSIFLQEILKHGSFLTKKSLNMGQCFCLTPPNFAILEVFAARKARKMGLFSRKILKNGCLFRQKSPLKMGMGLEAPAAPPVQLKSEYPPPRVIVVVVFVSYYNV